MFPQTVKRSGSITKRIVIFLKLYSYFAVKVYTCLINEKYKELAYNCVTLSAAQNMGH